MKILKFAIAVILLGLIGLAYYGYLRLSYTDDNYKWIDLRRTWPKGDWMQAKFVVMGNYGEEGLIFEIPSGNLDDFKQVLEQEIRCSPKSYYPRWDIFQLRIVTTKGKYTTTALLDSGSNEISANTWQSKNLKKLLYEWGYKEPRHEGPVPSDPNFAKKLYPDPNQP